MLAPVTHVLPLTTIRRVRVLPVPGKVVVRKGQKVGATDTIAEATLVPAHLLLDVARGLGLPADEADQQVQIKPGTQVAKGDVIAGPVGFTRRVVRSPRSGRVVLAGSGQVLLQVQGKPFALKAGLSGLVTELIPDRGAEIETSGALIQGVWGNGGIDFGVMFILAEQPNHVLTHEQIDVSMRGSVAMGGYVAEAEVLKTAAELPLRGLILSSMDSRLIPLASRISLPIIILDGFGQQDMNSAAYKLLSTNERREVAINAEPWDVYAGTRPELVISLPAEGNLALPRDTDDFQTGQQVRILRQPNSGQIGTLQDLKGVQTFPDGIQALAAEVRLPEGALVLVPLANLEVLG